MVMTRSALVRAAVLAAVIVSAGPPLEAARWKPAAASPASANLDVRPSAEIEARVEREVAKAARILADLSPENLFASPYLVSAIYYHDGFLAGFPVERPSADPERRIVAQICARLRPESKAEFVSLLHEMWDESGPPGPARLMDPVLYSAAGGGARSHRDAIDLFAPEGSPVHSVSRGIVILADAGWNARDPFSTSSRKGGNSAIVFDPDHDRFYRYCHMSAVFVDPGDLVAAGDVIGRVGHTGINASLPGHGHHLHFEANQYARGRVTVIDQYRLRTMLLAWPLPYGGGREQSGLAE